MIWLLYIYMCIHICVIVYIYIYIYVSPLIISGWWLTYPFENMSSSVGMMTFLIQGKMQFMFQTTNQLWNIMGILDILEVAICRLDCKWVAHGSTSYRPKHRMFLKSASVLSWSWMAIWPSKLTVCYWKWPSRNSWFTHSMVDLSSSLCKRLPRGTLFINWWVGPIESAIVEAYVMERDWEIQIMSDSLDRLA